MVASGASIPGSFWGDDEAGLIKNVLYIRPDTPVHSALHEACHFACMDNNRRTTLHTNAGGDADEENAVCYLQILLSDALPDMGSPALRSDLKDPFSISNMTVDPILKRPISSPFCSEQVAGS